MKVFVLDVGNAYQTNMLTTGKRVYLRCPPFYIEWFKRTYPTHELPPAKTCYVLQAVHSIEGTRSAGNEWYELSSQILTKMGMKKNSTDNAVFVFRHNDELMFLLSNVDDFLILSTCNNLYYQVREKLKTMFDLTTQESNVVHFLNLRIISSEYAITVDQTKHILSMVEPFFPRLQKFTRVNTPMRTDSGYEEEYANTIPATKAELALLEVEFGCGYLTLYGKLLHVATISRPQIANALSRLDKFQSMPNRFAFVSLKRIFQYLASNPNIPLIYPKKDLTTTSPVSAFLHQKKIDIPHCLNTFVDSNFATDLSDRCSVASDIILLGSVAVSWKVHKDTCIATSTTDAETRAAFKALRRIVTFRQFFLHLGFPISTPTPMFEDNKGTHDLIDYLHEKYKNGEFTVIAFSTHLMIADGLNKALSENAIKHHSDIYTGRRFLPPKNSNRYKQLTDLCPLS